MKEVKQRESVIIWVHLFAEHNKYHGGQGVLERRRELGKLEGEVNHERLWTLKNNLRGLKWRGGGRSGYKAVGIIQGKYCMEHWVWCINNVFCYTEKKLN